MVSGADRLGALPDEVLHHVLSFLPAHEAVATSLLARRWRRLWKSAPGLRVTGARHLGNPLSFIWFVDHLLLLRDAAARLDSFQLDLDERDFEVKLFPDCGPAVNVWLRLALLSQAQILSLRSTCGLSNYGDNGPLLYVPFIFQHLRRLDLEFVTIDRSTLDFSGCPGLVDLSMNISVLQATIRVTRRCYDSCANNIYGDCDDHSCSGCYSSDEGADDARGESMLLKGLSEVKDLELSVHSKVFIVNRDLKFFPTFRKLKTLFLSDWCPCDAADLNLLTYFLRHSPILEKLMLQLSKVPKQGVETESSYKRLEQSFTCSHLKIVEIRCGEVDGRLQETLDILSAYAIPLEEVNIQ
ncbi:unnamed protein product [Urochloa decumbens]|uniref:F-box domain-containing protein n=1 Tax=Urochloa decumbens TaxID=240449 RepID=A0ABC9B6I4_9POAL